MFDSTKSQKVVCVCGCGFCCVITTFTHISRCRTYYTVFRVLYCAILKKFFFSCIRTQGTQYLFATKTFSQANERASKRKSLKLCLFLNYSFYSFTQLNCNVQFVSTFSSVSPSYCSLNAIEFYNFPQVTECAAIMHLHFLILMFQLLLLLLHFSKMMNFSTMAFLFSTHSLSYTYLDNINEMLFIFIKNSSTFFLLAFEN